MAKSRGRKQRGIKQAKPQVTPTVNTESDLKSKWALMYGSKSSVIERSKKFARWTIPYLCPEDGEDGTDQTISSVAGGAQLVNNLANRIVDTMFPSDRPFFTLPLTPEADRKLAIETEDEVEKAKEMLMIKKATLEIEKAGMRELNLTAYRPVAVEAVKHMIVTGEAVIHRLADGERVVYGVKDQAMKRNLRGRMIEVLLRDSKKFSELDEATRADIDRVKPGMYKIDSDQPLDIYTHYKLVGNVWHHVQGVDNVVIPDTADTYTEEDFPCLDLHWNLSRGENCARGLVEDHKILFHNIDVCSEAVVDLIGIAADIKFMVNPGSVLDVEELNDSERGTYHLGMKDDITSPEFKHRLELETIRGQITEWYRMLSQAFLLNSGSIRDAERVTAEEIRAFARELESSFGGLYSKLALNWQQREAEYLMATLDFGDYNLDHFDVIISTGLESLSREGQLDALRLAIGDLQMLDAVPEDVRGTLDVRAFSEFVFTNRGMNLAQFVLSQEQLEAKQQAEQDKLQAETNMASIAKVAENAAQAAAKGEN